MRYCDAVWRSRCCREMHSWLSLSSYFAILTQRDVCFVCVCVSVSVCVTAQVAAHRCKAHDGYVSESQEGLVLVAFRDPAQVRAVGRTCCRPCLAVSSGYAQPRQWVCATSPQHQYTEFDTLMRSAPCSLHAAGAAMGADNAAGAAQCAMGP